MKKSIHKAVLLLSVMLLTICFANALADYPFDSVTMIVPYGAGGTTDVVGRQFAAALGKTLGTTFVVENQGGASGAIGCQAALDADKDGSVVLFTAESLGTQRVMDRLGWLQSDVYDQTVLRLRYNAVARAFMHFGFMGGYAAAFLWGVIGIRDGVVTYGMMTAFLQLVGQVQRPIVELARQIPAFIHATTSVERLMELQALEQEPREEPVRLAGAPGIRLTDVRLSGPAGHHPGPFLPRLRARHDDGDHGPHGRRQEHAQPAGPGPAPSRCRTGRDLRDGTHL